ncbi:cytidylyltransferase domain-containing protein [Aureivirga sp. CE67]|uniref:cytidylyltransferase domain-containing protein n=1 Tax=Aureivirga sp. CE67 TaxID=1788983 RepID=UPI0018CA1C22|nr:hypothetical protein [Aureivirga sp. CE67]
MLGIVLQARLGSTRLPKKMVLPFYNQKSVLEILLKKIKSRFNDIPIIVATTSNPLDEAIFKLCENLEIECYRGSEDNVLQRFIDVGNKYNLDKLIRVCADNPFLNINDLSNLINEFNELDVDYYSYSLKDGTPVIRTHYGFWAEGVKLSALKEIKNQTEESFYKEHVTNFIYERSNFFDVKLKQIDPKIEEYSNIRLTLDTHEDFNLLKEIYSKFNFDKDYSILNLLDWISQNKLWLTQMLTQIKRNSK